jgi:anti-sigma B factor antagonist
MTATQLRLTCEITAGSKALVTLSGELDIASSDSAFGCVPDVIDRHHVPVILDMAGLTFCDARGLGTLVRMSNYAGKAGCPLQPASPDPRLLQIMRITGLDRHLAIRWPQPSHGAGKIWTDGAGAQSHVTRRVFRRRSFATTTGNCHGE